MAIPLHYYGYKVTCEAFIAAVSRDQSNAVALQRAPLVLLTCYSSSSATKTCKV